MPLDTLSLPMGNEPFQQFDVENYKIKRFEFVGRHFDEFLVWRHYNTSLVKRRVSNAHDKIKQSKKNIEKY